MAQIATFQRLYQHAAGEEHPASEKSVNAVLRSMAGSLTSPAPFKVRLRMDDGSVVTVAPKGWPK